MTRTLAIILGLCFTALGLARLIFLSGHHGVYDLVSGIVFIIAGIVCFFHRYQ